MCRTEISSSAANCSLRRSTGGLDGLYAPGNAIVCEVSGIVASVDAGAGASVEKGVQAPFHLPGRRHPHRRCRCARATLGLVREGMKVDIEFNWDLQRMTRLERGHHRHLLPERQRPRRRGRRPDHRSHCRRGTDLHRLRGFRPRRERSPGHDRAGLHARQPRRGSAGNGGRADRIETQEG